MQCAVDVHVSACLLVRVRAGVSALARCWCACCGPLPSEVRSSAGRTQRRGGCSQTPEHDRDGGANGRWGEAHKSRASSRSLSGVDC